MEAKHAKSLLDELERIAEAGETGNFNVALNVDGLSDEERKAALLFNRILKNHPSATVYNVVRYELASDAFGLAHWDMQVADNNPLNPDNTFVWSPALRQMLGFFELVDVPDVLANWTKRLHPDDRDWVLRDFAAHLADRTGRTPFDAEHRIRMHNGEYLYVRVRGATLRDQDGMPLRVAGAVEDITSQKRTRDALRETEERMRVMLDASPFFLTMWDRNHKGIDCSYSTMKTFGFSSKQEFFERSARCLPEYQPNGRRSLEMLAEEMNRAFETGYNRLEWTLLKANGEPGIFALSLIRVKYKDDYALLIYALDIGKDKKMLAELSRHDKMLAAQTHRYKSLLDAIPLPLSVTDADMKLTFINVAAEKLFGRKREELLGQPCSCWNVPICGTADCSILRAKCGLQQTRFTHNAVSYKIDTEILWDLEGEISGFVEIVHDVTEIEKAARRQADEADEAKNIFLATMSHEMRTPLNAVLGLSELTLDNGGLNGEAEANIEKIYNAGSTLLSIVNDLLDLSKIRSGKFEIIPSEYDVPSMVNDAVAQNLMRIENKPVRFVLDIDAHMPARLYGDELRVKQLISNLLSNAFKYTEEGSVELGLHCEREDETVWMTIRVSDTGVGISPEHHAELFSDYMQCDAKASRRSGGTGLGLSITKSLAEMMGGGILVESVYGKGSVFTVKIRQVDVNDAVIGDELAEKLRNFRYAASKRDRNARLNRIRLPYARVLVVDDLLTNLDVAKGFMRPYGMRIDCATSGQEAIRAVREEKVRYNAIFMDHMMPGMDGVEATRRIRGIGSEYAGSVPIIALTANAVVGSEEMFLSNGFTSFISKPINMTRLDDVIRRFVRDKAQEALLEQGELEMRQREDRRKGRDRREGMGRRAADRSGAASLLSPGKEINGLDIAKGLENFGDEESYRQVLRSYAIHTKPLLESIRAPERGNLADYAITVHGIKGSSRGICADPAGLMAEALEHAARSGDFDFVRENSPAFLESVWKLVADIETVLDGTAESKRKPERDKPDSGLLARLQTVCEMYDLDGIDAIMREIDEYAYTADDGLVAWLHEATARLDYARMSEKIRQYIQGMEP